jgi:hypothetical protein
MDKESMVYHEDEERISAGEQRYLDWKKDNLCLLKDEFIKDCHEYEFEEYCKEAYNQDGDI